MTAICIQEIAAVAGEVEAVACSAGGVASRSIGVKVK